MALVWMVALAGFQRTLCSYRAMIDYCMHDRLLYAIAIIVILIVIVVVIIIVEVLVVVNVAVVLVGVVNERCYGRRCLQWLLWTMSASVAVSR